MKCPLVTPVDFGGLKCLNAGTNWGVGHSQEEDWLITSSLSQHTRCCCICLSMTSTASPMASCFLESIFVSRLPSHTSKRAIVSPYAFDEESRARSSLPRAIDLTWHSAHSVLRPDTTEKNTKVKDKEYHWIEAHLQTTIRVEWKGGFTLQSLDYCRRAQFVATNRVSQIGKYRAGWNFSPFHRVFPCTESPKWTDRCPYLLNALILSTLIRDPDLYQYKVTLAGRVWWCPHDGK